jgi:hypothetical protein
MSLNNREFLIWKERGRGVRESWVHRQVGQQAGILNVRICFGEIEGRDRDTETQRDSET